MTITPITENDAIRTEGLTKRFGKRISVDSVDLRVPSGSAFGLLGPNGAGKTTLMRMILGLTAPSAGSMALLGRELPRERVEALSQVGAIVEEPRFLPHLTGRQNLWALAVARGREAEARIGWALQRVGLAERANDRVSEYSMGMRQRLGVAACLLPDPALLMLDEPMNGLDPAGMLQMRHLIREFVAEGRTVILSSHLLDEIEKTCDAVAIIDRGRLIMQGRLEDLRDATEATVQFVCEPVALARALIERHPGVARVITTAEGVTAVLEMTAGSTVAGELNQLLVQSGVRVSGFGVRQPSLEDRFLEITSRLEATA